MNNGKRAPRIGLVLGAGGIVGHAFHAGVLSELARATGWDPRSAEVIVGTSAGSRVGALLRAGLSALDLAALATGEPPSAEGVQFLARLGPRVSVPPFSLAGLLADLPAMASPGLLLRAAFRPWSVRFGIVLAAALPPGRVPTEPMSASLRPLFAEGWPEPPLWVCAVRLADGQRVVFGRGVAPAADVGTAVAASCAIPGYFTPVEIDGARYVDGGAHSPTNLDILANLGLDLVIVSSPMSTASGALRLSTGLPGRMLYRLRLGREAVHVRRSGARVVTFQPTAEDQDVMGLNSMDPGRRRPVVLQVRETMRRRLESPELRAELQIVDGAARAAKE